MPRASRTVTTGAYPCPTRWTLAPPISSGWLTSSNAGRGSPVVAQRTWASNSRAAPRCTGPVSNLTSNVSSQTVNGGSWLGANAAPAVKSSNWVSVFENAWPSTTATVPL